MLKTWASIFRRKKKRQKKKQKLVLHKASTNDEVVPDLQQKNDLNRNSSPVRDSIVNSTGNLDDNVNTSQVDTIINHGK